MLPEPRTAAGVAGLAAVCAEPAAALVASDYDGTLAPIVPRPQDAVPAPGAVDALAAIARRVGTLAIVTGRPVRAVLDLARLGDHPDLGHLVILGHYGYERWDARTRTVVAPPPPPGVALVRARLPVVVRAAPPGVEVEDKEHALAVHTRRSADPQATLDALVPALTALAEEAGLETAPGRLVLELRPPGVSKGDALRALVSERAARSVLFAGDDLGDLSAFAVVEHLRAAGVPGVTVASRSTEAPEVAERADLVVDGPAGIVGFLRALVAALSPSASPPSASPPSASPPSAGARRPPVGT